MEKALRDLLDYGITGVVLAITLFWIWKREKDWREERKEILSAHKEERKDWKQEIISQNVETRNVIKELNGLIQNILFSPKQHD